jgi:cysteine synthase A
MSWVPSPSSARHLFYGILIGFSLSFASTSVISAYRKRRGDDATQGADLRPIELRSDEILDGVTGLIGAWSSSRPESLGLRFCLGI